MPDNLNITHPDDANKISQQDHEIRDWAKKIGVTPEALKKAVQKVGNDPEKVKNELGID